MSTPAANSALQHAWSLSQRIMQAAEGGDCNALTSLDAERMQLLQSFRRTVRLAGPADRALLRQISELNDRTIGMVEHQRRSKGREMDMAAVGRRAVAAYSNTRARR